MAANTGKLLLVTRDVDGGLGQHFVDLAAGMAARGWEVHCIRAERVEGHVTDHSSRLDGMASVTVHTIPLARAIGPGDIRSYFAFRRIMKHYGPFDVVHGHGAKGGVFARLACRRSGSSVYTPHGLITVDNNLPEWKRTIYGQIERFFNFWLTDMLITVSREEREEAIRLSACRYSCIVIPNGIAEPAFIDRNEARRQIGLSETDDVALFVGRFVYAKSPERFISAMARIAPKRPSFKAVLIGSGDEKPALVEMSRQLGIGDHVVFFETANAAAYMAAADLLVIPSRYEGLSYTMIEALAAGLPIVTFDVSGASELVDHRHSGYIVPQGNEDLLAKRVDRLIEDRDLRSRMAVASRQRFHKFSLESMIGMTNSVYDDAMWLSYRRGKRPSMPPVFSS